MLKAVLLQFGVVAVVVAVTAWWSGAHSAASVLLGAASCLIPNLAFFLYLRLAALMGRKSSAAFFVAEFAKIAVVIGILVVAHWVFGMNWLFVLIGVVAATQANLFAFLLKI